LEGVSPKISITRPEEPAVSIFEHKHSAVVQVLGWSDLKSDSAQILEGSGFFIDEQAHVVVAASVVATAEKIWVERGDESFAAEKVGSDPETNLALLRLLKKPERFTPISLQEGTENELRIGSVLVSIGSKLGMAPGPNQGLITGRNLFYGEHKFAVPYWRSSLAMDGGESGSPVFDIHGNFIGVLIASLPEIRSSFILPAFAVRRVIDELLQTGGVSHVSLGFSARQELQPDGSHRLSVIQVNKDSPAEKAGLQVGDELLRINDQALSSMEDLAIAIFYLHPSETILLNLSRREKETPLVISITAGSS
jgi:S1-C subfamily serine protease